MFFNIYVNFPAICLFVKKSFHEYLLVCPEYQITTPNFFFAVKSNFLSYDGLSFYLVCCFFRVIQVKIKVCFPNALAPRIQSFCFLTVFEPGSSKSSVPLWNCHIPCFPQHLHFQFFSFFSPIIPCLNWIKALPLVAIKWIILVRFSNLLFNNKHSDFSKGFEVYILKGWVL